MAFTDVTLSADGRTLFVTVQTGVGTDYQPGVLLPINVDLYTDADSETADVEPDLTNYLSQAFSVTKTMQMSDARTVDGGDEPSDVAVSPDGKFLYMANGGLAGIAYKPGPELGPNTNPTNPQSFNDLALAATSGLSVAPDLASAVRADIDLIVAQGANLLSAIGNTGVFSVNPQSPWQVGKFPSEIVYGWAPPAENGGRVVNQMRFRSVYAKRPFGITMRPDGNRALVSFFQTGNFGVLDLEHQSLFPYSPNDTFGGLVAVTQALRFDNFLWPSRGAYTSPDTQFVPSPDERLLFPTAIEYSQNGRFAAAVHTGVRSPGDVTALLPDFLFDTQARLSLEQIGFQVDLQTGAATDPNGVSVGAFEPYTFDRGGGAITILKDDAISRDLTANASRTITSVNGDLRPYYAEFPVCGIADPQFPVCTVEPFTQLFEYRPSPGTKAKFDRPRALGIQPFVYVESPRNGDAIIKGTRVRVGWRDTRITKLRVRVTDLGVAGSTLPPTQLDPFNATLTTLERNRHSLTRKFQSFFVGDVPVSGHRYTLEIAMQNDAGDTVSITEHEVRLK
jgi:hypothetical protein